MNVIFVGRLAVFVSIAVADTEPQSSAAAGVDASGRILFHSDPLAGPDLPGTGRNLPGASRGPGRPRHRNEAAEETRGPTTDAETVRKEGEESSRGALMVRREDPETPGWWSRQPFQWLLSMAHAIDTMEEGSKKRRVDCRWGSWEAWQGCSSSCGGGRKTRRREVQAAAQGGGEPCAGESLEELSCGEDPCASGEARGAAMMEVGGLEARPKQAYALVDPGTPCLGELVHIMNAEECRAATEALGLLYDNDVSWGDHISGCFALKNANFVGGGFDEQLHKRPARYDVYFNRAGGATSRHGQAVCKNAKVAHGRSSRTLTFYREARRAAPCPRGMRRVESEDECRGAAYLLNKTWNNESVGSWADYVSGCVEGDDYGLPTGSLRFNEGGGSSAKKGFAICEEAVSGYSVQSGSGEPCAKGSEPVRSAEECQTAASVLSKQWTNTSVSSFEGRVSGCFEGEGRGGGEGVLYFNTDNTSTGQRGLTVCKQAEEALPTEQSFVETRGQESLEQACEPGDALNPPESNRSYSSVWAGDAKGSGHARSMLRSEQAWTALRNVEKEWLEIDLGMPMRIAGLAVQGRKDESQWVTEYEVTWSLDHIHWNKVPGKVAGSSDQSTIAKSTFASALRARWVKLLVLKWHGGISMRAAVILCEAASNGAAATAHGHHGHGSRKSEAASSRAVATTHGHSGHGSRKSEVSQVLAGSVGHKSTAARRRAGSARRGASQVLTGSAGHKATAARHRRGSTRHRASSKEAAATPHAAASTQSEAEAPSKEAAATPHAAVSTQSEAEASQVLSGAVGHKAPAVLHRAGSAGQTASQVLAGSVGHEAAAAHHRADSVRQRDRSRSHKRSRGRSRKQKDRSRSMRRKRRKSRSSQREEAKAASRPNLVQKRSSARQLQAVPTQPPVCPPGPNVNPEETDREYSSVSPDTAPGTYSSALDSSKAWTPQMQNVGQWLQIGLGKVKRVRGIILQGAGSAPKWVTKYRVMHSTNGKKWERIPGDFVGCADQDTKVTAQFDWPADALYVRIEIAAWHGGISARAGLLTCEATDSPPAPALGSGGQDLSRTDYQACHRGEDLNPSEYMRSYSSVWGQDPLGSGHARSELDSDQAWTPESGKEGEWMEIKLPGVTRLWGTVVQGRSNLAQWVTEYKVSYSLDGSTWTALNETFPGCQDQRTKFRHAFRKPIEAVSVRLLVTKWKAQPSLRAGLVACEEASHPMSPAAKLARAKLAAEADLVTTTTTRILMMPLSEDMHSQALRRGPAAPTPPPTPEQGLPPIDCLWSGWSSWRECSANCGEEGLQRRERYIRVYPQNGGRSCGSGGREEERPCNRLPCSLVHGGQEHVSLGRASSNRAHTAHMRHNHRRVQTSVSWRPHYTAATPRYRPPEPPPPPGEPAAVSNAHKAVHLHYTTRDPRQSLSWPVEPRQQMLIETEAARPEPLPARASAATTTELPPGQDDVPDKPRPTAKQPTFEASKEAVRPSPTPAFEASEEAGRSKVSDCPEGGSSPYCGRRRRSYVDVVSD